MEPHGRCIGQDPDGTISRAHLLGQRTQQHMASICIPHDRKQRCPAASLLRMLPFSPGHLVPEKRISYMCVNRRENKMVYKVLDT